MDHPILNAANRQMTAFHNQFDGKDLPLETVTPFMQVKALLAIAEAINNLADALNKK